MESRAQWNPGISATVSENPQPASPILFRGPLEMSFARAARMGFDGIDLHVGRAGTGLWKQVGRAIDSFGIAVSAVATGGIFTEEGLSLCDTCLRKRMDAEELVRQTMYESRRFGAAVIIGSVRGMICAYGEDASADAYRRMSESLRRLAAFGESIGTTLAVEAINRYESDSINDTDALISLLDNVNSPSLRACLDTYHMKKEKENIEKSIEKCAGRLACFHISDDERTCPGATGMDLSEALHALKKSGYKGALTLEYTPCAGGCRVESPISEEEQATFARMGLESLRKQIQKVL